MRDLTLFLAALFIGMGFFALYDRIYGSADPIAGLYCMPSIVRAGDPVYCEDLSLYAQDVAWDFDGADPQWMNPNSGPVALRFSKAGDRVITVTASTADGRQDQKRFSLRITESNLMDEPQLITLHVQALEEKVTLEKRFPIDEVKDDHPHAFDADEQRYEFLFEADPGYDIQGVRLQMRSTSGMVNLRSRTLPDRNAAQIEFTLRSGPKADPYRAWFRGDAILIQSARVDSEGLDILGDFYIDHYGTYRLPRLSLSELRWIELLDSEGEILAAGAPGEEMISRDGRLGFRLRDQGDTSLLTVTKRRMN